MRKLLGGCDTAALDARAQIQFSGGENRVLPDDPSWAAEAVAGFVHSPQGRVYEYAIEVKAMAWAA